MSLLSLFKNSNPNNLHTILIGPDNFLNDYLAKTYVNEARFNGMDHVVIDCEIEGLDAVIASLTESSLFSAQKTIIVKNPYFLTSKANKSEQKQVKQLEKIMEHAQGLDDVIVWVASYEKIDGRKKIGKTIMNNSNVIHTQIRPYEVMALVKTLIKQEGYSISNSALQLLVERSDQIMDTILSNYLKLKTACVDKKITEKLVDQNIDLSLAQNIFAILESALKKDFKQAIMRLDDQLRQGSNPIQLLFVFENQLEFLLTVKILAKRGRTEPEIVKELAVHPYRVKLALQNRMNSNKLKKLLLSAIKLEFNYKNGTYQGEDFLKMFVLAV